jgi:hypothetical protein
LVNSRKRERKAFPTSFKPVSEVSRSFSGRFEAKYKAGDRAVDGSIIKEVACSFAEKSIQIN